MSAWLKTKQRTVLGGGYMGLTTKGGVEAWI